MLIHGISRNYPHVGRSYGGPVHAINLFKPSTFNNFYFGEASVAGQTEKAGMPVSGSNPYLFVYPPKSGGLSSRNNTNITFSDVANAVMGLPATGSATLTFTADGTGGLIVSGSGSATLTFSSTATLLSIAAASGSATLSFAPVANIGALAGLSGSATLTFTPTATSYAIGYLSGTSTSETEFSASALAAAVWEAAAADYNNAGTMGEKMNDAGSAGNPWAALLASNNSAGSFGEFVQALPGLSDISTEIFNSTDIETGITFQEALRIVLAALAGEISGAGTNTITIRDVNDTKDRITATVDASGNRTAVTVDGS